jgi:dCMP deaminase
LRDERGIATGIKHETCRGIHAEQNAIIQAGVHGININNSIMYCTHSPCMICAKMIVNAGIREFVTYNDYADVDARTFLEKEAGIRLRAIDRPMPHLVFKD